MIWLMLLVVEQERTTTYCLINFQLNYDKFKSLSRMGIETPSEFRSIKRVYCLAQEEATNNKVREMELLWLAARMTA